MIVRVKNKVDASKGVFLDVDEIGQRLHLRLEVGKTYDLLPEYLIIHFRIFVGAIYCFFFFLIKSIALCETPVSHGVLLTALLKHPFAGSTTSNVEEWQSNGGAAGFA